MAVDAGRTEASFSVNNNVIGPVIFIAIGIILFIFTVNGTMANLLKAASTGQPQNPKPNTSADANSAANAGSNAGAAAAASIGDSSGGSQTNYVAPGQQNKSVSPTSGYVPTANDWNNALASLNNMYLQQNGVVTDNSQVGVWTA